MAEYLERAGLFPPERKQDAERVLRAYWSDRIAVTWTVEDVLDVCPGLTDEEAMHVLEHALAEHDASVGVNWDVLQIHGNHLYGDRATEADEDDEDDGEDADYPDGGGGAAASERPRRQDILS